MSRWCIIISLYATSGNAEYDGSGCDVIVDAATGKDFPRCGADAGSACKSIRGGVEKADSIPGETTVCVKTGEYRTECQDGGIIITTTLTIRAYEPGSAPGSVTVDCGSKGQQDPAFTFAPAVPASNILHLVDITVKNVLSQSSGSAVAATGGALVVNNCHFEKCTSLAKGNIDEHVFYAGGGGALFAQNMRSVALHNSSFSSCSAPNGAGGAVLVMLEEAAPPTGTGIHSNAATASLVTTFTCSIVSTQATSEKAEVGKAKAATAAE